MLSLLYGPTLTSVHDYWKNQSIDYESESEVAQLCPTLCDPMDGSLPGSTVLGIFQARILEWAAISFSGDHPHPGIEPGSPALQTDALPSEPLGKPTALTIQTCKVMSLFFNMLSRFVIAFLPRSKHLLISWLQSLSAVILEPKKRKSVPGSTFPPSICHEVMGPDAMILVF